MFTLLPPSPSSTPTPDGYPDDNPKTAFGVAKVPLHLVPPIAIANISLAFDNGAKKYGPFNWREKTISSTVYYAAAMRHLMAWFDGEDLAPDSGVHHLAHVMACCAMVLDSQSTGKLNDNRPTPGAFPKLLAEYGQTIAPPENQVLMVHSYTDGRAVAVIKAIREVAHLGLKEAHDMVRGTYPFAVPYTDSYTYAQAKAILVASGAHIG